MKKIIFIVLCLKTFALANSQEHDSAINNWFYNQTNSLSEIDLSSILYSENCCYVGIFGENFRKISIRFDSVIKSDNHFYKIVGKSKLKEKICSFEGYIEINNIELLGIERRYSNIVLQTKGNYKFIESMGGVFKGKVKIIFMYSLNENTITAAHENMEISDQEGFVGVWLNNSSEKEYRCLFGFHRYPQELAKGFDNNGGEPLISPKYKSFGWDSHFNTKNPNYGYYNHVECNEKWWSNE